MTTGIVKEQNMEKQIQKQMGCMAGFLHIFDRQHFLTGKRFHSVKRLPPPVVDTPSESEKSSLQSPANSTEIENPLLKQTPEAEAATAVEILSRRPLPLPMSELKGGNNRSWKFRKETPRLSLDSRATTDAKGSLHPKEIWKVNSIVSMADNSASDTVDGSKSHRSPSVIARLMGLEPLPGSSNAQPEMQPELRRSASESRVSKALFQSRFSLDGVVLNSKQPTQSHSAVNDNAPMNVYYADPRNHTQKSAPKAEANEGLNRVPRKAPSHRKGFFDSGDVFPEPKQSVTIYGEIEKRIKMRGINQTPQDLETLKQILEALQLKGLLHSKSPLQQNQVRHRNLVYDESPIVLMKPSRSQASTPVNHRIGNDHSPVKSRNQVRGIRRNYSSAVESPPSISPRRERNAKSPTRTGRSPSPTNRSNLLVKHKQLGVETHRRMNESPENRKASPVHSPKINSRRTGTDPVSNRLSRSKKPTSEIKQKEDISTVVVADEESSSISTDTEARSKAEEYSRDGRSIVERCDKLLHSIAEMGATDAQPSPVSVLDSSFYKDDSLTPSPVTTKRNIDFKDQFGELEEEIWSPVISPIRSKYVDTSDDPDLIYISDILRAINYLSENSDIFLLLEKQQYLKGHDTSKVARVGRKLIYDTTYEIIDRYRRLPPWKTVAFSNGNVTMPSLGRIWSEFERMRECESGEDLFETICSVLKKDLAVDAINGWGDWSSEMSEAVLDIERLIFKDLICDSIGELSWLASRETLLTMVPRRKLIF